MMDTRVTGRYAKSLLELSLEQNILEEVKADMEMIAETCKSSREFASFLKSPVISPDKKASVIREIFQGKLTELSHAFINILISKGREQLLAGIAESFINQYKKHKNIITASVTTAFPLTDSLRRQVEEIVKEKSGMKVDLVEKVDKDIIGGFILKIQDQQIDSSISGKLSELKSEFSRNPYVKDF